MVAISQQSTTPQATMAPENLETRIFRKYQEYLSRGGPKMNDFGSQERPAKRARTMENNSHDATLSARVVFPNHNNMTVQQNSNMGVQFPGSHPAFGRYLVQNNMGAAYLGPITSHHGAQNSANSFFDYNAAPIDYRGAAGPGLVQNNTNPFMGHQPAQMNHGFVSGGGGVVQKRKFAGM